MLFLWIVGDNVEDKYGKVGYIIIYLLCGVVAMLVHSGYAHLAGGTASVAFDEMTKNPLNIPTIGASGAISGMMGAYFILFPGSKIKFFYLFWFYVGNFYLSSGWWIGLWFALQVFQALVFGGVGGVAVWAHIGGLLFGAIVTLVLVLMGVLPKQGSILAPPKKKLKKSIYRRGETLQFYGEGKHFGKDAQAAGYVTIKLDEPAQPAPTQPVTVQELQIGGAPAYAKHITQYVAVGDMENALELSSVFFAKYKNWKLPPNILSEIAEEFFKRKTYDMALNAYGRLVKLYPGSPDISLARFRLAMLYSRYLKDYVTAKKYLNEVVQFDYDGGRVDAAQKELETINEILNKTSVVSQGKPKLLSGPCSIIRQTDDKINIMDVGRLVSSALKVPMVDVTTKLKKSIGFVAQGVDASVAKRLANMLQKMNIPVLVVPDSELVDIPGVQPANKLSVSDEGVLFFLKAGCQIHKKWEDFYFISCGKVEFTYGSKGYAGPKYGDFPMIAISGGGIPRDLTGVYSSYTPAPQSKREYKPVVDFFVLNPYEHFRLREDKLISRGTLQNQDYTTGPNFENVMRVILKKGKNIPVNKGVHLLFQPSANWSRLQFSSEQAFNDYNHWQLQIVAYG